ncbi:hypothetical protein [Streptomyces sp. DH37]|uniref:hypothetical protein n=1 Tax=Streptomyces sp. DH37 TaxID=3040122 RepID=UPI00244212E4|nr:hypothetical protein [Streptomyces sp. DH37]MDG9706319.1 hypothetical protein [Streptomyces sp. DH37]
MELSTGASVAASLGIAVLLAALHLAAPRVRKLPLVPERATGSFAGGLAVAYVFLHLLPEVAEGNEAVGELLSSALRPTPLTDLGIFAVALAGFTCFYGLERLADRHGGRGARERRDGDAGSAADTDGAHGPGAWVYRLHLGSFLVYNALITYTMALRLRTGVAFALLFTVAMGLHFVLTDRSLEEHYRRRFRHGGRYALAAALLLGWGLSAVLAPAGTLLVSVLTAALAGSILLNVFKEEIPSGRRSSFPWFLTGLVLYAVLLAAVTALSE